MSIKNKLKELGHSDPNRGAKNVQTQNFSNSKIKEKQMMDPADVHIEGLTTVIFPFKLIWKLWRK